MLPSLDHGPSQLYLQHLGYHSVENLRRAENSEHEI
jgi:hypothetical protein